MNKAKRTRKPITDAMVITRELAAIAREAREAQREIERKGLGMSEAPALMNNPWPSCYPEVRP